MDARPSPQDRPPSTREILQRHGLRAKKSWGQNFLIDSGILKKIAAAAELTPSDTVVEVGPGLGVLTETLVEQAGKVIAIDSSEIKIQADTLCIHGDNPHAVEFAKKIKAALA